METLPKQLVNRIAVQVLKADDTFNKLDYLCLINSSPVFIRAIPSTQLLCRAASVRYIDKWCPGKTNIKAGALMIDKDRKICIVCNINPALNSPQLLWTVPTCKKKFREGQLVCARRAALERTGVNLFWTQPRKCIDTGIETLFVFFVPFIKKGSLPKKNKCQTKTIKVRWVSQERLWRYGQRSTLLQDLAEYGYKDVLSIN